MTAPLQTANTIMFSTTCPHCGKPLATPTQILATGMTVSAPGATATGNLATMGVFPFCPSVTAGGGAISTFTVTFDEAAANQKPKQDPSA